MASLSLKHVFKKYPNGFEAVKDFNLEIEDKEFIIFVGPSGCGKSTLGRTILQLYKQTDGRTMYYGSTLDDLAPKYMLDTINHLQKQEFRVEMDDFGS